MSADGQPDDAPLRAIYLNPPRIGKDTCPVCTVPKDPMYPLCVPCNNHRYAGTPLADFVAPLSWAPMHSQAYEDLYSYKTDPHRPVADVAAERLRLMFRLAFTKHAQCLIPGWENSTVAVVHVPSTNGRQGPHPMETILSMFGANIPRLLIRYVGETGRARDDKRVLRPGDWKVDVPDAGILTRVLVIDDSWVCGGHAQSIASVLKTAGVPSVGIVPFGRVLRMDWQPNIQYIRDHPAPPFNSEVCPPDSISGCNV